MGTTTLSPELVAMDTGLDRSPSLVVFLKVPKTLLRMPACGFKVRGFSDPLGPSASPPPPEVSFFLLLTVVLAQINEAWVLLVLLVQPPPVSTPSSSRVTVYLLTETCCQVFF